MIQTTGFIKVFFMLVLNVLLNTNFKTIRNIFYDGEFYIQYINFFKKTCSTLMTLANIVNVSAADILVVFKIELLS